LDFFARDDVALGFLATAACFVGAGRYDASDREKKHLQCANLSLFVGRLLHVVILFIFHLSQFLLEIFDRGFGLVLMGEKQTQADVRLHEYTIS
jgi:hypothetical protein